MFCTTARSVAASSRHSWHELGLDQRPPAAAEKERLADQAYQGLISQDQYREALVRLYGVTEPEQIERGKQVLAAEDDDVQFFPGVAETLIALKEMGYLLGIITDTANSVSTKLRWFEKGGFGQRVGLDHLIQRNRGAQTRPAPLPGCAAAVGCKHRTGHFCRVIKSPSWMAPMPWG